MSYAQLIERVVALGGLQQASEAERAVEATLPSLAEILASDDVEALRHGLPPPAARWLQFDTPRFSADADAFYARVASRSGLHVGFAREQAQAVLGALGEIADPDVVRRVARHLPAELGDLFEDPHRKSAIARVTDGAARSSAMCSCRVPDVASLGRATHDGAARSVVGSTTSPSSGADAALRSARRAQPPV